MQCLSSHSQTTTVSSPPYIKVTPKTKKGKREHERRKDGDKKTDMAAQGRTRYQSQQNQAALMGSLEDISSSNDFVKPDEFLKADSDTRLLTLITSLNKLHHKFDALNGDIHDESNGIIPRLKSIEEEVEEVQSENSTLKFEWEIMKGTVQRQAQQIESLTGQVIDVTARLMGENLLFSGIGEKKSEKEEEEEDKERNREDCVTVLVDFLENFLGINAAREDIFVAHRVGQFNPSHTKPRQILMKCHPKLKELILENKSKAEGSN